MKKKPIKDFTVDDWKEYNHERYERNRNKRLQYQHEYYLMHKEKLRLKANNRYRIKCGLGVKNENS